MVRIIEKVLKKSPLLEIANEENQSRQRLDEVIDTIAKTLKNYKENHRLRIGIVGEVKAGKSTLINALLKEALSPIGIAETTGSIIKFNNNSGENYIKSYNGNREIDTYENIKKRIHSYGSDFSKWQDVSVINFDIENEFLKSFELIDTPGLQTLNEKAEKVTEDIFDSIDLVIWVFNYNHYDQKSIKKKLSQFIKRIPKPIIAVINKTENVIDKEKLVNEFKRDYLFFEKMIKGVYPISALEAFNGAIKNDNDLIKHSAITPLVNHLLKVKNAGEQNVKYEANKELFNRLLNKYKNIHKSYLAILEEKQRTVSNYLDQELNDKEIIMNVLNSYSRRIKVMSVNETFQYETEAIKDFVTSGLDKNAFNDKNALKTAINDKLSSIFTTHLLNQKAQNFMDDVIVNVKSEIIELVDDSDYNFVSNEEYRNNLKKLKEEVLLENAKSSLGIASVSATVPAFFQAVLGSQAANITFLGAFPSFIVPGLLFGLGSTVLMNYNKKKLRNRIINQLEDVFDGINSNYKKQLLLEIDSLKSKLERIFKEKCAVILKENNLDSIKDIEVNKRKIEKFLENFDNQEILESFFKDKNFNGNDVESKIEFYKEKIKEIDSNIIITSSFKPIILSDNPPSLSLLRIELEQLLINIKEGNHNLGFLKLESSNNCLLVKNKSHYELIHGYFFDNISMKKINELDHDSFLSFYKAEKIINKIPGDIIGGVNILFNYLLNEFSMLDYVVETGSNKRVKIEEYIDYLLNEPNFTVNKVKLNYLKSVLSKISLNESLEKYEYLNIRNYILEETDSVDELELNINKQKMRDEILSSEIYRTIEKQNKNLKEKLLLLENDPTISQEKKIEIIVNLTALTCSLVAVQPIPFADIFILTPIQMTMAMSLNRIMKNKYSKTEVRELIKMAISTVGWGFFSQQLVLGLYKTILPFMGAVTTLPLVYASTYALGKVLAKYFDQNEVLSKSDIKNEYKKILIDQKEEASVLNPFKIKKEINSIMNRIEKNAEYQESYNEIHTAFKENESDEILSEVVVEKAQSRLKNGYPNISFTENFINYMKLQEKESHIKLEEMYKFAEFNEAPYFEQKLEFDLGNSILVMRSTNDRKIVDIISKESKKEYDRIEKENQTLKRKSKDYYSEINELNKAIADAENMKREYEQKIATNLEKIYALKDKKIEAEDIKKSIENENQEILKKLESLNQEKEKYHKNVIDLQHKNKINIELIQKKDQLIASYNNEITTYQNENVKLKNEVKEKEEEIEKYKNRSTFQIFRDFMDELNSLDQVTVKDSISDFFNDDFIKNFEVIKKNIKNERNKLLKFESDKKYKITNIDGLGRVLIIEREGYIFEFNDNIIQSFTENENMLINFQREDIHRFYFGEEGYYSQSKDYFSSISNYILLLESNLKNAYKSVLVKFHNDEDNDYNYDRYISLGSFHYFFNWFYWNHNKKKKFEVFSKDIKDITIFRNKLLHPDEKENEDFILTRNLYLEKRKLILETILPKIPNINIL